MVKEQVDHPDHYNQYPVEVIDMMEKVFGIDAVYHFCLLNAFKYRMRMGNKIKCGINLWLKNIQEDLDKEKWYLKMAAVYKRPETDGSVIKKL